MREPEKKWLHKQKNNRTYKYGEVKINEGLQTENWANGNAQIFNSGNTEAGNALS